MRNGDPLAAQPLDHLGRVQGAQLLEGLGLEGGALEGGGLDQFRRQTGEIPESRRGACAEQDNQHEDDPLLQGTAAAAQKPYRRLTGPQGSASAHLKPPHVGSVPRGSWRGPTFEAEGGAVVRRRPQTLVDIQRCRER